MTFNHELDTALLRMAVRDAVHAPSSHNSQPWAFSVRDGQLELRADRKRVLPVVDPDGRELVISCGAALGHLCASLRHRGVRPHVELTPDPGDHDLLARVTIAARISPLEEDEELFHAIAARHTNRSAFERREIPLEAIVALRDSAEAEGAWLAAIQEPTRRHQLAALIAEGDRAQWSDPEFRKELAQWLRPNGTVAVDGLPSHEIGIDGRLLSHLVPLVVRRFDRGDGEAAHDAELAEGAPLLAVLGATHDTTRDWMVAGLALSRVLLRATALGISASFLNQAIEVPRLREKVRSLVAITGQPLLILRFGYGRPAVASPRRPLSDVMV
ncbi:MAG: Acg family FMN-binding oxidoreductase [Polyangiales bacterium]